MNGLQTTVVLGAVVFAGSVLAPRLRMATPLLLLLLGLGLGFIPQLRAVELPPETVLLLFLPVMLFWESLTVSLLDSAGSFRRGISDPIALGWEDGASTVKLAARNQ